MDDSLLQGSVELSFRERGYIGDRGFSLFQVSRVSPSALMCVKPLLRHPLCSKSWGEISFKGGGL
jgi:hypothetical protein